MTVAELIELLRGLDQDRSVMMRGYEGGFTDIDRVSTETIKRDVNEEWYYGPHEGAEVYGWRQKWCAELGEKPSEDVYVFRAVEERERPL